MNHKFFSLEEAERLLSFLDNTFDRIHRNKHCFLWLQAEVAILQLIVECGAGKKSRDAIDLGIKQTECKRLADEIQRDVALLSQTGCIIKDLDKGLIDFYSMKDDSVIFLCWQKGEDSIKFWHALHDGYAGRQPIVGSSA